MLNYNEFCGYICKLCSGCATVKTDDNTKSYCYGMIYSADPGYFVGRCFQKLKNVITWPEDKTRFIILFKGIFCSSSCPHYKHEAVFSECKYVDRCVELFKRQIEINNDLAICKRIIERSKQNTSKIITKNTFANKEYRKPVMEFIYGGSKRWKSMCRYSYKRKNRSS